jgi:hypothetical protein
MCVDLNADGKKTAETCPNMTVFAQMRRSDSNATTS